MPRAMDFDAFRIFVEERNTLVRGVETGKNPDEDRYGSAVFTYGEVTAEGVQALIKDVYVRRPALDKGVFVDLGSGQGVVTLGFAALGDAAVSIGVELAPDRHVDAVEARSLLADAAPDVADRVSFVEGDVLRAAAAVASADVIYCANLCFPSPVNAELGAVLNDFAKPGLLLYTIKEIPGLAPSEFQILHPKSPRGKAFDRARLVEKILVRMTWGMKPVDVRVYEFHGEPVWAKALPKRSALDEAFKYWSVDGTLRREALVPALEHALLHAFVAADVLAALRDADPPLLERYNFDAFQEVYAEYAARAESTACRASCWDSQCRVDGGNIEAEKERPAPEEKAEAKRATKKVPTKEPKQKAKKPKGNQRSTGSLARRCSAPARPL